MEKERREVGQEECRREAEGRGRRPLRRLQLRSLRLAGQHWTHEGERRARGLPLPLSHWDLFTCQEDFCRVCGDLPVASDPSSSLPQAPRPYLLHIRLLALFCHPPPKHTHTPRFNRKARDVLSQSVWNEGAGVERKPGRERNAELRCQSTSWLFF